MMVADMHDDAAFERSLLDSARNDLDGALPAEDAWARFASAAGGFALVATTAAGTHWLSRALHHAALKWIALGAVAGSAATAAWLGRGASAAPAAAVMRRHEPPPAQAAAPVPSTRRRVAVPAPASAAETPAATAAPAAKVAHRAQAAHRAPAAEAAPAPSTLAAVPSASSLYAEVAALDTVQATAADGDFARAVELVDAYHRDFPHGQLAPDAEALAVEALAHAGRRVEASRRARRFLATYPNDPHAARIAAFR